jgi:hypothetical protein
VAFPVVQATNKSATSTAGTSHTVNLPASIAAGDLLIVLLDKGSTAATVNALAGWTELLDENSGNGLYIAYRKADGTEGATITLTTSANTRSAEITYRISGAQDPAIQAPEIGTTGTGTSATPDPPTCTPTGGTKTYLWIAVAGMAGEEADDDTWSNTPPTNYLPSPPLQKSCGIAGTNLGGLITAASFGASASSQDPGTFGVDVSAAWRSQTIAIHPAPVTVDGNRATTATETGTIAVDHTVNGTRPITATETGTIAVDHTVGGNLAVTATITGDADVVTGGSQVDVDGTLAVTANRTATIAADHTVDGALAVTANRTGTIAVDHTVDGSRATAVGLTATAVNAAVVAGSLVVITPVVGDAVVLGRVDVDGALAVTANLAGDATAGPPGGIVEVDGDLVIVVAFGPPVGPGRPYAASNSIARYDSRAAFEPAPIGTDQVPVSSRTNLTLVAAHTDTAVYSARGVL